MARSLYTDKEVFVRELISNASDALEKLRHLQLTGKPVEDAYLPQEVQVYGDEEKNTLTIQDFGIGMSKEELISYLGTIAHSGSLKFLKSLDGNKEAPALGNIIGQFGVGFYSTFMVANKVKVYSRSATPGSRGHVWVSEGAGSYEIAEAEGVTRGTKIILYLKDECKEFSQKQVLQNIVKKYSNFVNFDIKLNGVKANTVKALWMMPKTQITEQEHKEFYQFVSGSFDSPQYSIHYHTDSPINIRSLFYIPEQHTEKYGMGRMEPGVSLFSRRVLIQAKSKVLLPEWLRFVKGVVDSEDIPLNLSREHLQDSHLIRRVSSTITKRILKTLDDEKTNNRAKYETFFKEFGGFLKEGVLTDFKWKEDLGKLLLTESSFNKYGKLTTLDEYVARMKPDQKEIYYLCVPSRQFAENSPYYEAFKKKELEVLFCYTNLDDFVMANLQEYAGKPLKTIESAEIEVPKEETPAADGSTKLDAGELKEFLGWMKEVLAERVVNVKDTYRLTTTPAIVVDHESAAFRRMMKFVDPGRAPQLPKQLLEVNPAHPLIVKLNAARKTRGAVAKRVAEQIYDNALIAAGLVDDARGMLGRVTAILEDAVSSEMHIHAHTHADAKPQAADKPDQK